MGADESNNFPTGREELQKRDAERIKNRKVHLTKWFSVEHGEEVLEKVQRYLLIYRMRQEDMEEQFKKDARQGWRCAADAARVTDGNASSEDRKHTSGGVFVAVDSNLGAVVGKEEGAVALIPGKEGRTAQAWVNARG